MVEKHPLEGKTLEAAVEWFAGRTSSGDLVEIANIIAEDNKTAEDRARRCIMAVFRLFTDYSILPW